MAQFPESLYHCLKIFIITLFQSLSSGVHRMRKIFSGLLSIGMLAALLLGSTSISAGTTTGTSVKPVCPNYAPLIASYEKYIAANQAVIDADQTLRTTSPSQENIVALRSALISKDKALEKGRDARKDAQIAAIAAGDSVNRNDDWLTTEIAEERIAVLKTKPCPVTSSSTQSSTTAVSTTDTTGSNTKVLVGAGVGLNSSNAGSGTTGQVSVETQTNVGTTTVFNIPTTFNAGIGLSGNFGQITGGSTTQGASGSSSTSTFYNTTTHQYETITTTTPGTPGGTRNRLSNMGTVFGKVGIETSTGTQVNVLAGVSTVSNSGGQNTGVTTGVEVAQNITKCGTQVAATYTNTQISQTGLSFNSFGVGVKVPVDSCTFGTSTSQSNPNATDPALQPNPNIVTKTDDSTTNSRSSPQSMPRERRMIDNHKLGRCIDTEAKPASCVGQQPGFRLNQSRYDSCMRGRPAGGNPTSDVKYCAGWAAVETR